MTQCLSRKLCLNTIQEARKIQLSLSQLCIYPFPYSRWNYRERFLPRSHQVTTAIFWTSWILGRWSSRVAPYREIVFGVWDPLVLESAVFNWQWVVLLNRVVAQIMCPGVAAFSEEQMAIMAWGGGLYTNSSCAPNPGPGGSVYGHLIPTHFSYGLCNSPE